MSSIGRRSKSSSRRSAPRPPGPNRRRKSAPRALRASSWCRSTRPRLPTLNPKYRFDTFVVGTSNQFAHAAARAVAESPFPRLQPALHLRRRRPRQDPSPPRHRPPDSRPEPAVKMVYISAEKFMNELINAIRYDRIIEFRNKHRSFDVLLVDDIQFIAGKERTQEEFFHTFNALYDAQKQIVLSSDAPPREIPDARRAPALALRVGPHRGHPGARSRDQDRHPEKEGGRRRSHPSRQRRDLHRVPHQIQHPRARGLSHPPHRLLVSHRPHHRPLSHPGGPARSPSRARTRS